MRELKVSIPSWHVDILQVFVVRASFNDEDLDVFVLG
jgi:hypothetical protein